MKTETVREMWESFAASARLAAVSDVQRTEMRRAFMAGCWAMLQGAAAVAEQSTEDDGASGQPRWEDELKAFYRDVAEGKA